MKNKELKFKAHLIQYRTDIKKYDIDIDDLIKTLMYVFNSIDRLDNYVKTLKYEPCFYIYYIVYTFIELPNNDYNINTDKFYSAILNDSSAIHYFKYFEDIQTHIGYPQKEIGSYIRALPLYKNYSSKHLNDDVIKIASDLKLDYITTIDSLEYFNNVIKTPDVFPDVDISIKNYQLKKLKYDEPLQMFTESYMNACRHIHNGAKTSVDKTFNSPYHCNCSIWKKNKIVANLTLWLSTDNDVIIDCISSYKDASVNSISTLLLELHKIIPNLCLSDTTYGITSEVRTNLKLNIKVEPTMKDFCMYSDTTEAYKL